MLNKVEKSLPTDADDDAFEAIFNPRGIAMIGATEAAEKAGGRRWKTLVEAGFSGGLYPIHPKLPEVRGRKAFRSLHDVPGEVDIAIVAIPPSAVPDAVDECIAKGVRGIVIITAGFGEVGLKGREIERRMVDKTRAANVRLFGPNCAGIFSGPVMMNACGWAVRPGNIGLVSQSGNMALDFADLARKNHVGFSRSITIGNSADVKAFELVGYYLRDPATEVVLAYIEGFGANEGRQLCEIVRRAPVRKPVVILKPGRSESGSRAALSHTGSLAGEDRLVEAAFAQCGIVRAYEAEEAWETALAFSRGAKMTSPGVAVLTDGGGHATLFCDAAGLSGLIIPTLSEATQRDLAAFLPERCPVANPVDFAGVAEGEPGVIPKAMEICLRDPAVGATIMVGHFGGYHRLGGAPIEAMEIDAAHEIANLAKRSGKPVHVHSVHAESDVAALNVLREAGVSVHRGIEMGAKVLRHLAPPRPAGVATSAPVRLSTSAADAMQAAFKKAVRGVQPWLQEPEARAALVGFGIDVPQWRTVETRQACIEAIANVGGNACLKLISPDAVHKSDIGGVALNVTAAAAVGVFDTLQKRASSAGLRDVRVLVTPMVAGGVELVMGAFRDAQFGPIVMVGMGGILVELLKDVQFRLAPVSMADATVMLKSLRGHVLLDGYRGSEKIDAAGPAKLLSQLSEMIAACDDLAEVDLNPVIVGASQSAIADVRIVLGRSGLKDALDSDERRCQ